MHQEFLDQLDQLLTEEEVFVDELKRSRLAAQLAAGRTRLLEHVRGLVHSDDLSLIIKTEKTIIEGDLSRYANSAGMTGSLEAALEAMQIIEHHITLVGDKEKYRLVDQTHRLEKNRKAGLPFDEARQALAGHATRLSNMDKARLDEADKQLIDVRKTVIANAAERYAQRQAHILGIERVTRSHQG